jgi:AAA family ATP:ADP antiporter
MIHLIERLLHLREGDLFRGLPLVLYLFFVISSYMMAKVARDVLFLDRFEAVHLPYVDMTIAVVVGLVMAVYIRISRRTSLHTLILGSLWLSAGSMVGFWWLVHYYPRPWLYPIFYVWVGLFGVLATSQVWTLANFLFTTRETKRLVGMLGSGAIAGGIIGGFFSTVAAGRFGTESLLLITAVCIIFCSGLVHILWQRRNEHDAEPQDIESKTSSESKSPKNLVESMGIIWGSTYLLSIAGVICLASVVTALVGWQFKAIAKVFMPEKNDLAAFFGLFYGIAGIISLLVQLLLTSRLLKHVGLGVALMVLPISLIFGATGVLIWGTLAAVIFIRGADNVIRYSIDRSTVEMLYLPVPTQIKMQVKPFIDTVIWRLGDGFGGVIVLVFATFLAFSPQQLSWLVLLLLLIWVFVVIVAKRHYVHMLSDNIQQYRLDAERTSVTTLERSTIEVLKGRLSAGDAKEILYALELFELEHHTAIHPVVRDLLAHASAAVRQKALVILNAAGDLEVRPQVDALLQDEDIGVRTEALLYLAHHAHIDPLQRIRELGDFPNFSVQSAMVTYLASPGKTQSLVTALTILDTMVHQDGVDAHETRLEAARLIAVLPDHFDDQLAQLLQDEDDEVMRQALRTVGLLEKRQFLPQVLEHMRDQDLASEAIETLGAFGDSIVDSLLAHLQDKSLSIEIRREIPRALLSINTVLAEGALSACLLQADAILRMEVITSLNGLHQKHPEFNLDTDMVETVLLAEITGQYRCYQMLHVLKPLVDKEESIIPALHEDMNLRLERIFRLMALQYPRYDLLSAMIGFQSGNHVVEDNAIEFLDNILKPNLRAALVPLLDRDVSHTERVRFADQMTGSMMTQPEDAIHALLGDEDDEDHYLKSCAIYTIGLLRLKTFCEEVERYLTHDNPLLRETARQTFEKISKEMDR